MVKINTKNKKIIKNRCFLVILGQKWPILAYFWYFLTLFFKKHRDTLDGPKNPKNREKRRENFRGQAGKTGPKLRFGDGGVKNP